MAAILTETIPLFVEDAARKPFRYGSHDCALFLANWGRVVTGIDGAAHLRGRYKSALGCARIIRRAGGLSGIVGECADNIGFVKIEEPRPGDVGVIVARTVDGVDQISALRFDATRWAFLTAGGGLHIGGAEAAIINAWGLR